jgi:queuine tRNA-ribosyltransferase
MTFKILKKSKISKARVGKIKTPHGEITTPCFMPVATRGAVKNLTNQDLEKIGAEIILSNTYHLLLRPGLEIIKKAGGLHKFIGWPGPILTDSGGYQVFSLSKSRKITDRGVEFRSEIDGKKIFLSPEKSLKFQIEIGSDICMILDECPFYSLDKKVIKKAVERTTFWAQRSKSFLEKKYKTKKKPLVFGIIQGGVFKDLREKSLKDLLGLDFDGLAIGGLMVGEPISKTFEILKFLSPLLPQQKPRYLMGAGLPEQIIKAVQLGIDMFDCVIPTRHARHGEIFVFKKGVYQNSEKILEKNFYQIIKISKSKYKSNFSSVDKFCSCYTCKNFSLAFLHHLQKSGEPLYQRLATLHNLKFYFDLIKILRDGIKKNKI